MWISLDDIRYRLYELNEIGWWAHWAEVRWFDEISYVILSNDFPEPLFNHCSLLAPHPDPEEIVEKATSAFDAVKAEPSFILPEAPSFMALRESLLSRGYIRIDRMAVLELASPDLPSCGSFELMRANEVEEWASSYLLSFYGELSLLSPVTKAVAKASEDPACRLLLAKLEGKPVGTLALYQTDRFAGAYCVGVLPAYRKAGVATALLQLASQLAEKDGKKLILQTFLSESVEGFYLKRGFMKVFIKDVFVKRATNIPGS